MTKKILISIGTRPEAIKMAPLYHALKSCPNEFDVKMCVSGQHQEMLHQALGVFNIAPELSLNLKIASQTLANIHSAVLSELSTVLNEITPDILLVHGDTTTAIASAIAAFYCQIPIGHVEAGLRTGNLREPFPEEFNRQVISKIATWHFTPTEIGKKNLIVDGVNEEKIFITGNTIIDSLGWMSRELEINKEKAKLVSSLLDSCLRFRWRESRYVLITGHRRENFGNNFLEICNAILDLAKKFPNVNFIYPVHLNPMVQKPVNQLLSAIDNVHLLPPLRYEEFILLLKHCEIVLTDSGGIQEEAPSFSKPVLVMRNTTERPEAINAGTARLVGSRRESIVKSVSLLLEDELERKLMMKAHNPYGNGDSCKKIIFHLRKNCV